MNVQYSTKLWWQWLNAEKFIIQIENMFTGFP